METFKNECILNLDQSMLTDDHHSADEIGKHHQLENGISGTGGTGSVSLIGGNGELDLVHTFNIHGDCDVDDNGQSSPLMDLEKPIMNISVENLSNDKY